MEQNEIFIWVVLIWFDLHCLKYQIKTNFKFSASSNSWIASSLCSSFTFCSFFNFLIWNFFIQISFTFSVVVVVVEIKHQSCWRSEIILVDNFQFYFFYFYQIWRENTTTQTRKPTQIEPTCAPLQNSFFPSRTFSFFWFSFACNFWNVRSSHSKCEYHVPFTSGVRHNFDWWWSS